MSLEGQQLGEFEILERLGQGGMGAVYKARQTSLDRIVALKTLQPTLAGDADYIARFRQEAKAAALLSHPNLVHVHSAGESEGLHWFAMEYIEGESAQRRLDRKGRINPAEAIAIVMHVAAALDYGWRKAALIHRDIKPDNIFLSSDGEVKLGDLGLAKSVGQAQGITTVGATMGTPHYISPEQAEAAKDVDLRANIYSLGCTLFHMLTGREPYHGDTAMAVMIKHVNAPVPDLRALWPECPAVLAEAVMKMMQKQPDDRQQTYEEVRADLQRAYDAVSGAGALTISGGKKRFPAAWGIGAAMVCAAVGALLYFAPWKKSGQPLAQSVARSVAQNPVQPRVSAPATPAAGKTVAPATTPAPKTASTPAPSATPAPKPSAPSATPALSAPSVTPKPLTEMEKWLAQVDGREQEAFEKQVLKPFEAGAASLRARYLAGVDAGIARSSAAGQLQDALAWRSERQSFEKAQNVPPDDTGAPAIVIPLREDFRQQLARLDQDRAARAKMLHAQYDAVLAQNETLLTQRQRLDDALLLKKKRDEIARVWLRQPSLTGPGVSSRGEFAASGFPLKVSKGQPFVNTLGMKFVPVPGTKALFSIWDTRVQDYEVFATETGRFWRKPGFEQGPAYPAVNVNWNDAQAFCAWLTERERKSGKLRANELYRLPTDYEWSCAAEIGEREDAAKLPKEKNKMIEGVFPWGAQWPPPENAGNYASLELKQLQVAGKYADIKGVLPGYRDGYANTSPVGTYPANRLGLFDMGGNVWQWCEDWVDSNRKARVLRGASWKSYTRDRLLSSARFDYLPGAGFDDFGFRCVIGTAEASPSATAKEAPFVNTLGMKFVPVPGTKALFSVWDTRVQDYAAYAQANNVNGDWKTQQENGLPVSRDPEYPVVGVNWEDARAFCRWLTETESAQGKLPRGAKYRLPTDEEWSRAVGLAKEDGATPKEKNGKDQVSFPWGSTFPPPRAKVGNYADAAFHEKFPDHRWINGYEDGYATTSPVGAFPPNEYGLYDMGGNVWQWCEDLFEPGGVDPVQRGASWRHDLPRALLSSNRNRNARGLRFDDCGFRCVLAEE